MKIIQLGSNVGDRKVNISKAIKLLGVQCEILSTSGIYETSPWGNTKQDNFLNQLVKIEYNENPYSLLRFTQWIENEMGRTKKNNWGPRIIDIDIIFYCNKIIFSPDLEIPHSRMHERKFVLEPMAQINKEFIHPLLKTSIEELLLKCKDTGEVKLL